MGKARPNDCGAGEKIGRYTVVKRLGKGAMGEVYLCHDEGLVRDVAVKILSEGHRHNAELRARFVREARAVARVTHPNVVQIFFIDTHDGLPYFAMEYLKGRDLGGILSEYGPLEQGQALAVIHRAASGLAAAARAGVVHRDVKPANILVTDNGEVKLTDFGLAKTIHVDPELTAAGLVVGTPDYISPEQARGEDANSHSDVYSLGCTLYHLIQGSPPFRRKEGPNTYMAILSRHMHMERPDLGQTRPDTDADVAALCIRMMSIRSDERPDFENLLYELGTLENRLHGVVPPVHPSANTDAHPTVSARPSSQTSGEKTAKSQPPTLVKRTGLPGWSLVVTALSVAFFLTGLGLRLSDRNRKAAGREPEVKPYTTTPVEALPDAGTPEDSFTSGIPWTTVLVSAHGSGRDLYVSVRPVSVLQWENYRKPKDEKISRKPDDSRALLPMVGVSFKQAEAFARYHGARLPRSTDWERIRKSKGVLFPDPALFEWVSVGSRRGLTVRVDGAKKTRKKNKKYGDVTFRIVWEAIKAKGNKP